jgi:hypothetical protein
MRIAGSVHGSPVRDIPSRPLIAHACCRYSGVGGGDASVRDSDSAAVLCAVWARRGRGKLKRVRLAGSASAEQRVSLIPGADQQCIA